jgi:hypothetical protein
MTLNKPDLKETRSTLEIGISILATHPGRIRERLIEAFHKELHLIQADDIAGPDLSVDAKPYWQKVQAAVTAQHDEKEGSYAPSIEAMTEEEASRIAEMITGVASMISLALERE